MSISNLFLKTISLRIGKKVSRASNLIYLWNFSMIVFLFRLLENLDSTVNLTENMETINLFSDGSLLTLLSLTFVWVFRIYVIVSCIYLFFQTENSRKFLMKISNTYIPPPMQLFSPKTQFILNFLYDRRIPFLRHLKEIKVELITYLRYFKWKHSITGSRMFKLSKPLPIPIWDLAGQNMKRGAVRYDSKEDTLYISKNWNDTVDEFVSTRGKSDCIDVYLTNHKNDILAREAYGKVVFQLKKEFPKFEVSRVYLNDTNADLKNKTVLFGKSIDVSNVEHFDMQHPKNGNIKEVYLDKRGSIFGENRCAILAFNKDLKENEWGLISRTDSPKTDVMSVKWWGILTEKQNAYLTETTLKKKLNWHVIKDAENALNLDNGTISATDITTMMKVKARFATKKENYVSDLYNQLVNTKLAEISKHEEKAYWKLGHNPSFKYNIDVSLNSMFDNQELGYAQAYIQNRLKDNPVLTSCEIKININLRRMPFQPFDWITYVPDNLP